MLLHSGQRPSPQGHPLAESVQEDVEAIPDHLENHGAPRGTQQRGSNGYGHCARAAGSVAVSGRLRVREGGSLTAAWWKRLPADDGAVGLRHRG